MIAFIFLCLVLQTLAFSPVLGRDADQNEYPFLVALETCQKPVPCFPQCGGVVLSKSWILTLSSCIYRGNVRVNAGVVDLSSPDAQIREVEKAVLHPEFNYSQPYSPNNIGLLKLKTPLDLGDSVQPGVLPKQGSDVPLEKVTQLGWFINKDGRGTPISVENLETVDTGIVDYYASSPTLSRDADQNEYPFIVAVETCGYPICYPQCAGVVISKSWILTLGSCAYIADYDHFRINAGVVNLTSEDAQLRDIEKSVLHPEFDYWQPFSLNNIGLLKLKTPLDLGNSVQPGVLPKQGSDIPLGNVTQLGWFVNRGQYDRPISVQNLETAETAMIDYNVCMAVVEPSMDYKFPDFAQTLLCTGDFTGREDLCFVNDGSPTVQGGVVVGIYYYRSLGCGVMGSAMLSLKTGPYVSWIQENIDEEIKLA